jgi:hypothetical protein
MHSSILLLLHERETFIPCEGEGRKKGRERLLERERKREIEREYVCVRETLITECYSLEFIRCE